MGRPGYKNFIVRDKDDTSKKMIPIWKHFHYGQYDTFFPVSYNYNIFWHVPKYLNITFSECVKGGMTFFVFVLMQ